MKAIPTPRRLSAWRDRYDARARGAFASLPAPIRVRARRLANVLLPVVQCGIAAGLAWFFAFDILHHPRPFFAPIAAILSIGIGSGRRLRRAVELIAGVVLGVGIGDLLIRQIGTGPWQIAAVVILAMSVAVFLDSGVLVSTQAASSAVLVATLLPPGGSGGVDRMVDTAVGGLTGIVIIALLPTHPIKRARREAGALLGVTSDTLADVARGLRIRDSSVIAAALTEARATQSVLEELTADTRGGREVSRISPFRFRQKERVSSVERIINPLDNGIRNVRVLARRAIVAVDDQLPLRDELIDHIDHMASATRMLRLMVLADPGNPPTPADAARELRRVAAGARRDLVDGAGLTETVILAQTRSILVDLLQVAGLSKISALATLPPTVSTPAVMPDVWDDESDEARIGRAGRGGAGAERSDGGGE